MKMSAKLLKRAHTQYELLERMLNKTTLTTQRVAHSHIVDLGNKMVTTKADDSKESHEKELHDALEKAEARATRELKAALKRLRKEKDEDKAEALQAQKEHYENLAQRIEEQRNAAEKERERELLKKFIKEKEEALEQQWEECEKLKEEAIQAACDVLTKKLRNEFVLEKEKAVAEALKIAKEKYKIREQQTIERIRKECELEARKEAERVAKLHQKEIERHIQRYNVLEQKYHRELDHKRRVENDFRQLQEDYRRFMNYTDGKFHSDYLMKLRYSGKRLAEKKISTVEYEDIMKLPTAKT